ncbi:MAG: SpoIIE family protein phosphatase [Anaerolineae bacterium]|nr:SpoIIE family protein phosphatase [Anaerolineae bacterium]
MLKLVTSQKIDLFNSFIQRWHGIVGSEILFLSPQGELLANSNGVPPHDWPQILAQASPNTPTFLTYAGQEILITPLAHGHQTLGYLLVLDAHEQDTPLLKWGAETLTARLTDEMALQDMTDELIGAWDQLELVYRVTQNLALTSDLMATLKSILQEIRKVVDTENGFILLKRSDGLECVTCSAEMTHDIHDESLLNNLIEANQVVLCNEAQSCRDIWPNAPDYVEDMLATPLPILDEEDTRVALGLINKANKNFTAGDVKLLAALAQQVGTIIRNFLTHQKLVSEERLSRELEIAAEIQESFLPTQLPQMGGLSIAVASIPASEVGGDFYDFITVDDRNLTLVIGDVAGKGIPAAMLTSVTRTMLRVEAMRGEPPHAIVDQANNVLHQDLSRIDSFATVFVATVDTYAGTLNYASAGHTPGILWRANARTSEQLRATSPPIGIFGYQSKVTKTIQLNPGDTLVLCTDGITEAQAPNGNLFGLNRLTYIIESWANESPEALQQTIQAEITNFRRNAMGRDDATLLIIKMLPQAEGGTPKDISTIIRTEHFSYPAHVRHLGDISQKITAACRELPALPSNPNADDFIYLIELAISEICTNIIKHAYGHKNGNINGRITLLNNGIQLDFYDTGKSFDPNTIPSPKSDPSQLEEGGYGLHIVRQIMDVVSYEHDVQQGNHWYLLKLLPPT